MEQSELATKQRRLAEFLERHALDGVLLQERANFAWITCGGDNHVANNTPLGVAAILVTRDGTRVCLTDAIEAPRMRDDELGDRGIDVVEFPWFDADAARKIVCQIIAGRRVAADIDRFELGLATLPPGFVQLRWTLTESEIDRYRDTGARASRAIEDACGAVKPGMRGHDIAGLLDQHVHVNGLNPVVTLVGVDEQIERFRHPIPTNQLLRRCAMLVTCAESHGLIANLTRLVHFGSVPPELRRRHHAACTIDAAIN
ncbi:MAG: M24 family metallopeptidase, partial [Tepidisphaeraceae bacterium]